MKGGVCKRDIDSLFLKTFASKTWFSNVVVHRYEMYQGTKGVRKKSRIKSSIFRLEGLCAVCSSLITSKHKVSGHFDNYFIIYISSPNN